MPSRTTFRHEDCGGCIYLGPFGDEGAVEFDLWFCPQGGTISTVMARYGDGPSEYHSGIQSQMPPLVEAKRRAATRGLL